MFCLSDEELKELEKLDRLIERARQEGVCRLRILGFEPEIINALEYSTELYANSAESAPRRLEGEVRDIVRNVIQIQKHIYPYYVIIERKHINILFVDIDIFEDMKHEETVPCTMDYLLHERRLIEEHGLVDAYVFDCDHPNLSGFSRIAVEQQKVNAGTALMRVA